MGQEQEKKGARTGKNWVKKGLERGPKRVLNGNKNGISPNSTIWNGVERPFFAVPHLSCRFLAVPPRFSPVFHDFGQKREKKRVPKNGGTGKERTRSFPVSFLFPFFPVPCLAHLYFHAIPIPLQTCFTSESLADLFSMVTHGVQNCSQLWQHFLVRASLKLFHSSCCTLFLNLHSYLNNPIADCSTITPIFRW